MFEVWSATQSVSEEGLFFRKAPAAIKQAKRIAQTTQALCMVYEMEGASTIAIVEPSGKVNMR